MTGALGERLGCQPHREEQGVLRTGSVALDDNQLRQAGVRRYCCFDRRAVVGRVGRARASFRELGPDRKYVVTVVMPGE
jgi:hypothetical protein